MLEAFLDYQRATVVRKCEGLSEEEIRRPMVVSGTNILGIVQHLGYHERWWFQEVFAAQDPEFPSTEEDPDAEFHVPEDVTTQSVVDFYEGECAKSRAVSSVAGVDDIAEHSKSTRSLRWILLHMIEETARHAGHIDILREMIDGRTGQ